jgi:hypothetical protein
VNDHDERIGTIDDIIIGRDHVLFAVLQVGGFLADGPHATHLPGTLGGTARRRDRQPGPEGNK